jgi:hypothetical protein
VIKDTVSLLEVYITHLVNKHIDSFLELCGKGCSSKRKLKTTLFMLHYRAAFIFSSFAFKRLDFWPAAKEI